jgi:hypothetical protein
MNGPLQLLQHGANVLFLPTESGDIVGEIVEVQVKIDFTLHVRHGRTFGERGTPSSSVSPVSPSKRTTTKRPVHFTFLADGSSVPHSCSVWPVPEKVMLPTSLPHESSLSSVFRMAEEFLSGLKVIQTSLILEEVLEEERR